MISRRNLTALIAGGALSTQTDADAAVTEIVQLPTMSAAVGMRFTAAQFVVQVAGFHRPGDGGAALYVREPTQPLHFGKFQSADGAWWSLADRVVVPQMLGARGDGEADDSIPFIAALGIGRPIRIIGDLRLAADPGLLVGADISGEGHAADQSSAARSRIIKDYDGALKLGDLSRIADVEIRAGPAASGDNLQIVGSRVSLTRVTSSFAKMDAIRIGADDDSSINANFWSISSCIALAAQRHGMYIHHTNANVNERWPSGLPNCNAGVATGFDARACGQSGLLIGNAADCTFIGGGSQNNAGPGVVLTGDAQGHRFIGFYAEANGDADGTPGQEILIRDGAGENAFIGLRHGQLAGSGLRDENAPGRNLVEAYDSGLGRHARQGEMTIWNPGASNLHASLLFASRAEQLGVAELRGEPGEGTGGIARFSTKQDRNILREAWSVDEHQTLSSHHGEASTGWAFAQAKSGETIRINRDQRGVDLDPEGPLDSLLIKLPDNPIDGQMIGVTTTKDIESLQIEAGAALVPNALNSLAAGNSVTFRYRADRGSWFRQN